MTPYGMWKLARVREHLRTNLTLAQEALDIDYSLEEEAWYAKGLKFVEEHGRSL